MMERATKWEENIYYKLLLSWHACITTHFNMYSRIVLHFSSAFGKSSGGNDKVWVGRRAMTLRN